MEDGYAVIQRANGRGDRVGFVVPMAPQRIKADRRVAAGRGRVALRYGPLIYNIESVDGQDVDKVLAPDAPLAMRWDPDLLGGVMVMEGAFSDLDRR
ncbi:MAG: glycoside hydrolase family 127 protein [Kiritimatiellia bacterium]